jgi:large subunit ribosomal protein L25
MKATLQAATRSTETRGDLRKLRADGVVPGVLYGFGETAQAIQIKQTDLRPLLRRSHGATLLIDLRIGEETAPITTVIREVQRHPVTRQIIHCDLLKVDLTRKYHVTVPIVLVGEPIGVKNFGGVMDVHIREIDVRCRPDEIPESYTLDVSGLMIGDSIRVVDIPRGNEEFLTHVDVTVVSVATPRKVVEAAPAAALEGEEAAEAAAEGEEAAEGGKGKKEEPKGKKEEPKGKKEES